MIARLRQLFENFLRVKRRAGLRGALRATKVWVAHKLGRKGMAGLQKNDVVGFYGFASPAPFGTGEVGPDRSINWVIPDFDIGSGGHTTIFRMIQYLERWGFECRITIREPCHFPDGETARRCIREHFFPLEARVGIGREAMQPSWATVATSWHTAYDLRDFQSTAEKFYFIQDYEPWFYPVGSESVLAENTYRFGFRAITAGDWLAELARERYGMEASPFGFAVDREVYHVQEMETDGIQRVFFYARPVTPRRGFELGMQVLAEVAKRHPDVEFVLAGWDTSGYHIPFNHRCVGTVSPRELGYWFNQSHVALVLSLTNLSLLPLELMACNCAVVSNRGPNVEWLLNEENAVLVDANVPDLAEAVSALLTDEPARQALVQKGREMAANTEWTAEADKVRRAFESVPADASTETGVAATGVGTG